MTSRRISVRISPSLDLRLRRQATAARKAESELVREALDQFLKKARPPRSAYNVACELGLIGCYDSGPADLSTNRKHLQGFGRSG